MDPDDLLAGPAVEAAVAALAERDRHHAEGEEVTVHATFWPEMQDLGGGEIAATPAQVAALELLEQLTSEGEE